MGKAQDVRHRAEKAARYFLEASIDYMYLAGNKEGTGLVLVGHGDHTHRIGAWVLPVHGGLVPAPQRLVQWANDMGHAQIAEM